MIVSEDMLIDTVDDQDRATGVIKRSEALLRHVGFRVVHILLFNHQGDLLLQQLALTRPRHPGAWGSSVAAYVAAGETYWQAAQRRLPQELGVTAQLRELGKTTMLDEVAKKFITVYTGSTDGVPPPPELRPRSFVPVSRARSGERFHAPVSAAGRGKRLKPRRTRGRTSSLLHSSLLPFAGLPAFPSSRRFAGHNGQNSRSGTKAVATAMPL
ncbi:MAG: NUDIX domain-containing protein [Acidobacteriia bacterium]|nr:NUDIX domain-containing protein [Terriglobia bacterium]